MSWNLDPIKHCLCTKSKIERVAPISSAVTITLTDRTLNTLIRV